VSAKNIDGSFVVIEIDGKDICSRESFHKTFADAFGFPDYCGKNMDAWIECMGELANPEAAMTQVNSTNGIPVTILLKNMAHFKKEASELYDDLVECVAFVNWRQLDDGLPPLLALAFYE
jgi:RNAse (barnase) inhibitor barstar